MRELVRFRATGASARILVKIITSLAATTLYLLINERKKMSNVIRQTLIESKMQVLESLQVYISNQIEDYRKMLSAMTPMDEGYTGEQDQ